jgi:hypothetical protein
VQAESKLSDTSTYVLVWLTTYYIGLLPTTEGAGIAQSVWLLSYGLDEEAGVRFPVGERYFSIHKPKGRGFQTPMRSLNCSIYLILPVALCPGDYSASNKNEYQKLKNNVSGQQNAEGA